VKKLSFNRHPGENRGPGIFKGLKILDSGFRRNDEKTCKPIFSQLPHQAGGNLKIIRR
jgi:hypothetical protein